MAEIAIIGGGISGLSLAYALVESENNLDVVVIEAEGRPGGKIWTEKSQGFVTEGGVPGFLDNKLRSLELATGLSLSTLRSNDSARKRYVYLRGGLRRLPESPPAFLKSDILSLAGKLRVACEVFMPKGRKPDESLAEFARRRLGKEAYESLIDPMASGIYAGDPEVMSLRSCFPKIYEIESRYGSLIRGMFRLQAEARKKKTGRKVGAGPGGTLTSFPGGMGEIIGALRDFLGGRLRVNSKAIYVEKRAKGYSVGLSDGSRVEAETVVVASPAHAAAEILSELDRPMSSVLEEIRYPAVSVVCLGYERSKVPGTLDLFGYLVPKKEGRKILGVLYESSIFSGRAPEGHVLLRVIAGGARASELALQDDAPLMRMVLEELRDTAGIKAEPDFHRIYRHEKAIPQYALGHPERLKRLDDALLRHPGLYLTGNAYRGIGFNDCIENSWRLSETIRKEAL